MDAQSAMRAQVDRLREIGFVVIKEFLPTQILGPLNDIARAQLRARAQPLELEADLQYPGAPPSRIAAGGMTVRRLLDAFSRAPEFAACAVQERVGQWMQAYFGEDVFLSRAHHNCLMTKHPRYGSLTGWHRDIRYWSFPRDDLVSIWLALGEERIDNGALWFVPGSHRTSLDGDRYDTAKFLRANLADNSALIATAESPHLRAGDAVLFHCNTLHAAGRNAGEQVKFSLVFTYHGRRNAPLAGTRSAAVPEVGLPASAVS